MDLTNLKYKKWGGESLKWIEEQKVFVVESYFVFHCRDENALRMG